MRVISCLFLLLIQKSESDSRIREQPGWGRRVWLPEAWLACFTSANLFWPGGHPLWFCFFCPVPGSWLSPGLSPRRFHPDDFINQRGWRHPLLRGRDFPPSASSAPPSPPPPSSSPPPSAAQDLLSASAGHYGGCLRPSRLQRGSPGGPVHPGPCPVWAEGSGHMAAEGIPLHSHPVG